MKRHYFIPNETAEMDIQSGSAVLAPYTGYFGKSVINATPGITTDAEVAGGSAVLIANQLPNVDGYETDATVASASVVLIAITPEP